MKKIFLVISLVFLMMIIPGKSFSQAQNVQKAPAKPALVVIDIQNAFLPSIPERDRETTLQNINFYIQTFRDKGYPVIRVYQQSDEYGVVPGTDPFEFPTSVLIKPEDPRVIKTYPDGFNKTDLDKVIKETGSNTLFLCGLSAVGCVLATWIGAQNHDYTAFLLKDAIMSHNSEYTDNVEMMFDAVSYDVVKLILDNSAK